MFTAGGPLSEDEIGKKSSKKPLFAAGCLGLLLLGVLVPAGGLYYWRTSVNAAWEAAKKAHAEEVQGTFDPALQALEEAAKEPEYDIDQTIRVIHEIDVAMASKDSLDEYLQFMATHDYRGVAPEVLEARKDILDLLLPLYAKQVEAEDQQAMWEMTSEMLIATLSVVGVSGEVSLLDPSGAFEVDQEQAKVLWDELKEKQSHRRELKREIDALNTELFGAMMNYADVYYKYVEEWDQLSVLRDRAYLATRNGDWPAARAAAEAAIEKAPKEKEAHLLLAMSIIEEGNPEELERAKALLTNYIEEHPDHSAPAFVLMGVAQAKMGDTKGAELSFQQSSAYYPKQADKLTEMVDPYKMRSFLRKSREGSYIIELYKSTMLGAGYFSPDLQQAKVKFDAGDFTGGKQKVLDHFARRRNQQQWDFIISDIEFCHELLGPEFWQIFPQNSYLDLETSQTMMGSKLNLSINNRSDKTLRNATLILVLQLTDMYPGMYEALPAPETVPAVNAHESTSFGTLPIELEYGGKPKTVEDIVQHRAILVSNDAVTWVDTDEYKIGDMKERQEAVKQGKEKPISEQLATRFPQFSSQRDEILGRITTELDLQIESKYGSDNVLIKLPKELSILRPVFRLKYGDEIFTASDNVIDGDQISLRFPGVENFDDVTSTDDLQLVMASPFGDIVLSWESDGALTWNYEGITPAE